MVKLKQNKQRKVKEENVQLEVLCYDEICDENGLEIEIDERYAVHIAVLYNWSDERLLNFCRGIFGQKMFSKKLNKMSKEKYSQRLNVIRKLISTEFSNFGKKIDLYKENIPNFSKENEFVDREVLISILSIVRERVIFRRSTPIATINKIFKSTGFEINKIFESIGRLISLNLIRAAKYKNNDFTKFNLVLKK